MSGPGERKPDEPFHERATSETTPSMPIPPALEGLLIH